MFCSLSCSAAVNDFYTRQWVCDLYSKLRVDSCHKITFLFSLRVTGFVLLLHDDTEQLKGFKFKLNCVLEPLNKTESFARLDRLGDLLY